ncbi:protein kinase family protein [Herbidospora sp. RD11066]
MKICDFGIARYADATTHLTASGGIIGSPAFMAPEQYRGEPIDARTDLYALGCTLHTMLTGQPPFTGAFVTLMHHHLTMPPPRLTEVRPDIPAELERLALRLLAKDPRERPSSAEEVATTLHAADSIGVTPPAAAPALARRPVAPIRAVPPNVPSTRPVMTNVAPHRSAAEIRRRRILEVAIFAVGITAVPVLYILFGTEDELITYGSEQPSRSQPQGGPTVVRTLAVPRSPMRNVVFSPDGEILAVGYSDNVSLWSWTTSRPLAAVESHAGALAFSPDGKFLATGVGKAVRLTQVTTRREAATFKGLSGAAEKLTFSPDGKQLAATDERKVRVWRTSDGHLTRTLSHPGDLMAITFSPDGRLLATSGRDGRVRVWDIAEGRVSHTFAALVAGGLAFAPDGQLLIGGSQVVSFWFLNADDPRSPKAALGNFDSVAALALSPDGLRIATGDSLSGQKGVQLWDVVTGRSTGTLGNGHVGSLAFSPDGDMLAVGDDEEVTLWRLR